MPEPRSPKPKSRLWLVTLTERYEVKVWAATRDRASKLVVVEFGGNDPVWSHVTARRITGTQVDAVFEETHDA